MTTVHRPIAPPYTSPPQPTAHIATIVHRTTTSPLPITHRFALDRVNKRPENSYVQWNLKIECHLYLTIYGLGQHNSLDIWYMDQQWTQPFVHSMDSRKRRKISQPQSVTVRKSISRSLDKRVRITKETENQSPTSSTAHRRHVHRPPCHRPPPPAPLPYRPAFAFVIKHTLKIEAPSRHILTKIWFALCWDRISDQPWHKLEKESISPCCMR